MAKSKKSKEPPRTVITFEIDDEVRLNDHLQRVNAVTVTARRGDLGYVAEVEMADLETDLLPVIEHVQRVFFNLTADGLPPFPDLKDEPEEQPGAGDDAAQEGDEDASVREAAAPEEIHAEGADGLEPAYPDESVQQADVETYTVALYEPEGDLQQGDDADAAFEPDGGDDPQLSLWG